MIVTKATNTHIFFDIESREDLKRFMKFTLRSKIVIGCSHFEVKLQRRNKHPDFFRGVDTEYVLHILLSKNYYDPEQIRNKKIKINPYAERSN